MNKAKSFNIPKQLVFNAYKMVKANRGSAGIDNVSIDKFEEKLKDNLYKLWNRMSSGAYFPAPVKAVEIPKKDGGIRVLGIPTVEDRIAQMVVKMSAETNIERIFKENSFGYRPRRSAHDAIKITRKRCWKYNWVLEFDIKGLFDNIDHELLMKAVDKNVKEKWQKLYIERWLKASMVKGKHLVKRNAGTPQGGLCKALHKPPYAK